MVCCRCVVSGLWGVLVPSRQLGWCRIHSASGASSLCSDCECWGVGHVLMRAPHTVRGRLPSFCSAWLCSCSVLERAAIVCSICSGGHMTWSNCRECLSSVRTAHCKCRVLCCVLCTQVAACPCPFTCNVVSATLSLATLSLATASQQRQVFLLCASPLQRVCPWRGEWLASS
jgi:hypothetical protein